MADAVIRIAGLNKHYDTAAGAVPVLKDINLAILPGELVAIMGPSGSGKSTFMNILGCLDIASSGSYFLNGEDVRALNKDQLARLRNEVIGFVFQGFNLLPRATALTNVALPLAYAGVPRDERERRARRALEVVGLRERMHHRPLQLSGGQQQRVAIARALVNAPALLLADEPTGNLDSRTAVEIMAVLQRLNALGLTTVLVTHEPDVAAYARRQITFRDGRVIRDEPVHAPRSAASDLLALRAEQAAAAAAASHSVRVREEPAS